MYRLILFFSALALMLFASLYTPYHGQLVIVFAQDKFSMDLWFAIILWVLLNLLIWWFVKQLMAIRSITMLFSSWKRSSRIAKQNQLRQKAIMAALAQQYDEAISYLKSVQLDTVADQIMYITWLNQTKQSERLESALSALGQNKSVQPSWMIWFRAYLFNAQGRKDMALQLLLDALEKGLYSKQIIRSAVLYADISEHFLQLLTIEKEIRSVLKHDASEVILECYQCLLETLLQSNETEFVRQVERLPRDMMLKGDLVYYQLQSLNLTKQYAMLEQKLLNTNLVIDKRILPLIIDLKISISAKVQVIQNALISNPNHPDLLYVLSYLNVHSGQEQDALKLIEHALESSLGVKLSTDLIGAET
jgi:uncharacterized protein HemY